MLCEILDENKKKEKEKKRQRFRKTSMAKHTNRVLLVHLPKSKKNIIDRAILIVVEGYILYWIQEQEAQWLQQQRILCVNATFTCGS